MNKQQTPPPPPPPQETKSSNPPIIQKNYEDFQKALQSYNLVWIHDTHDPTLFQTQCQYLPYVSRIVVPCGLIQSRVVRLAKQIYDFYSKKQIKSLTLLVVLRGAYNFARDLQLQLQKMNDRYGEGKVRIVPHFVTAKSYVGTESKIQDVKMPELDVKLIEKQDVLIVEDILDTGGLMNKLCKTLDQKYNVGSVNSVVLIHKRNPKNLKMLPYPVTWFGFTVPDLFVVGYGLDYNQQLRNVRHIYEISENGIEKFKDSELA